MHLHWVAHKKVISPGKGVMDGHNGHGCLKGDNRMIYKANPTSN